MIFFTSNCEQDWTLSGTFNYQIPNDQLLISVMSFEDASSSWIGGDYQLTDLSHIPRWAH